MAGIGFALRRLEHRDELTVPMADRERSVVAAGPWRLRRRRLPDQ
jgi:hypothetical protein